MVVADVQDLERLEPGLRRDLMEDPPTRVVRAVDAQEVGEGRREIDGRDPRHIRRVADARACGDEGAVHVDRRIQVDELGEIPVLPEELAEGDQLTGRRSVRLVRRTEHDDHVATAVRMQRVRAVDVAELFLEEDALDDLLARVRGVGQVLEVVDDLLPDRVVVTGRDLRLIDARARRAADRDTGRIAAGEVQVELGGPTCITDLDQGIAGRVRGSRRRVVGGLAAVAALLSLLETQVDERPADVDRVPLRREPMVGAREDRRLVESAHQVQGAIERLVRLVIGVADVALANRDSPVGDVVVGEVVVVRVRVAVDVDRDRQPQELVGELVGDRVAQHQEIGAGLDLGEDVLEGGPVEIGPLEALLDVRVLVDDPGLERREVGRGAGGELVDERALEIGVTGARRDGAA